MKYLDLNSSGKSLSRIKGWLQLERALLELSWTNDTAYPDERRSLGTYSSNGQCFVTSYYLFHALKRCFGLDCVIQRGQIIDNLGRKLLSNHCWISFLDKNEHPWIIDLTADQSFSIGKTVLIGPETEICRFDGFKFLVESKWTGDELGQIDTKALIRCQKLIENRQFLSFRAWSVTNLSTNVRSNLYKRFR